MHLNLTQEKKTKNIIDIYENLSRTSNLIPSPYVNNNFSKLVSIASKTSKKISKQILQNEKIISILNNLRKITAKGEYELEKFWAKKIIKNKKVQNLIKKFPYFYNYEIMIENEIMAIKNSCQHHNEHRVLFVGSGPLPLTSILIKQKYNILVDNLDKDKQAINLSQQIIELLKLKEIQNINIDILKQKDFSKYNIIIIAALVGNNEVEKNKIVKHIIKNAQENTHIILRGVEGLGELLYSPVSDNIFKYLKDVKKYDSPKGVINNVIIGTIK
jgi:nicotianamine synthase